MIKIEETEDYIRFENWVVEGLYKWKVNLFWEHTEKNDLHFSSVNYHLHGEAGSGKTAYLACLEKRLKTKWKKEPIRIQKILDIKDSSIFILDALNEIPGFQNDELIKQTKSKKAFVITASWYSIPKIAQYNINPSEETLKGTDWDRIKEIFPEYNFSIREKFLMFEVENLDELIKKEPHSIPWKAFEKVLKEKDRKNTYKKMVKENPIKINKLEWEGNWNFKWMLSQHIVQSTTKGDYQFSHPNISMHLFLRKKVKEIKNLVFFNDDLTMISKNSSAFLWWAKVVNKNWNKIKKFIEKNKIPIRTLNLSLFPNLTEKEIESWELINLSFEDIVWLDKKKWFQTMYNNYINENISKFIQFEDISYELSTFSSIIIALSFFETKYKMSTEYVNKSKIRNAYKKIKIVNSNDRHKMLNFILLKMIKFYYDETFSPLITSKLDKELFSYGDKYGLSVEVFVNKAYDKHKGKLWNDVESIHNLLDKGLGRDYILDNVSKYGRTYEKFQNFTRGTSGINLEHISYRYVHYEMYEKFEKIENSPSLDVIKKSDIASTMGDHKNYTFEFSIYFLHFLRLLVNETIYWNINILPAKRKFDPAISKPPKIIIQNFQNKKIESGIDSIRNYIVSLKKDNMYPIKVEMIWNTVLFQDNTYFLFVIPKRAKSIYDDHINKNSIVLQDSEVDPFRLDTTSFQGYSYNIWPNEEIRITDFSDQNEYILFYNDSNYNGVNKAPDSGEYTFEFSISSKSFKEIKINRKDWIEIFHGKHFGNNREKLLPILKKNLKS